MEKTNEPNTSHEDDLKVLLARVLANQQPAHPAYEEEEEIDWMSYIQKLLKGWKLIATVACIFAVLGVGVALMQQRTYTVRVTLAPEAKGSAGSSLGGIASMLGMGSISTGSSSEALNVTLFPEISTSTPFLVGLFEVPVTPYVSKTDLEKGQKPADPQPLFDYLTPNKKSWLSFLFPAKEEKEEGVLISNLTKKQNGVVQLLNKSIQAEVDKKTGIITVSVTMNDPQIATQLADTVCARLQNTIIQYRTQKAKEDYDFYTKMSQDAKDKMIQLQLDYAKRVDWNRDVILESVKSEADRLQTEVNLAQTVYQQMEAQKASALAKYQELKPVFAVLEPATFPQAPNQSRKNTVLVFLLAGILLSGAWVALGKDYYLQFKEQLKAGQAQV